ncbi:helix-turn-helix domain-containing protein [Streptomyces sp. NPDC005435]|uniref:helix-turn-helix domain-containing protein n=1 Tax=Streptomyces sp. NPDC005435 TaxID=3154464 RepID=UPI003452CCB2
MQELLGRLTALDPEASETLKVVAYFDALVVAAVGIDGLLRAAAAMSGAVAGIERRDRVSRFSPEGRRLDDVGGPCSPELVKPGFRVWLEREGAPHANDEMVVERLALALELRDARHGAGSGLEIAVDAATPVGERVAALAALRVDAGARIRLVATSLDDPAPQGLSTVVPTRYGMLRATLDAFGTCSPAGHAGLGPWVGADHAPTSWNGAIVAYRLTGADDPVIDAASLGVMLELVQSYDPDRPHEDVVALGRLDAHESEILRALVESDSVRSAAARLGIHHTTLRARHETLTRRLGYDPRTPVGRMRAVTATLLLRLHHASPPRH